MCKIKPPLSFDDQLDLLISRNLIVHNRIFALNVLKRINYYRLNGYTLTLREDNKFYPNVHFEHVVKLYEFDKKLRILLMGTLESIEVAFRTHVAYQHGQRYGALGYLEPSNFNNMQYHRTFINRLTGNIEKNKDKPFVVHHLNKYGGKFPIWVVIELLSFGEISKLYSNLRDEDRKAIASDYQNPDWYIVSWLRFLTVLRNECAHYGRLYNCLLKNQPKLSTEDKKIVCVRNSLFAAVTIVKKLLSDNSWGTFMINLEVLLENYTDVVDLKCLGFPTNWDEYLR